MKKKILFALAFVAGIALISLAADPVGGKAKNGDPTSGLRAQIAGLCAEVDALRERTKSLEATVDDLKHSHIQVQLNPPPTSGMPSPATAVPLANPSRPPTIWGQGEVNGWTYYIVPCEQPSR